MSEGEQSIGVGSTFPESTGSEAEFTAFRDEVTLMRRLRAEKRDFSFIAGLPTIVGFVSTEEQEFFATAKNGTSKVNLEDPAAYEDLLVRIPGVSEMIMQDLAKLELEGLRPDACIIDRRYAKAGQAPKASTQWHVDRNPLYLVSDTFPTEFYSGGATVKFHSNGFPYIEPNSIDTSARPTPAPPYAIVRQGPFTVHRTPTFSHDSVRTLMVFATRNPSEGRSLK